MGKEIKDIYRKKGLTPPEGKGIHTKPFHQRAADIMEGYSKNGITEKEKNISYATAMKQLGRNKSVNPSHRRKALQNNIGGK